MSDPLLKAIADYRAGLAAYNATPDCVTEAIEDQVVAVTYEAPMRVLMAWTEPAQTMEGAIAALRMVREENGGIQNSPVADRMLEAALAYFDRQEAPHE